MNKGFGIAALVFAILSIFIPAVSIYVVWLALVLATLAALTGDKVFSFSTFLICLVNVIFLSPLTMLVLVQKEMGSIRILTIILFLAPIAGLLIRKITSRAK